METNAIFSWLNQPAVSAVATCTEASPSQEDVADTLLAAAYEWPHNYPDAHKKEALRIRFHFQRVNQEQAKKAFQNIMVMYREHLLFKNKTLVEKWTFFQKYLIENPLGPYE